MPISDRFGLPIGPPPDKRGLAIRTAFRAKQLEQKAQMQKRLDESKGMARQILADVDVTMLDEDGRLKIEEARKSLEPER